MDNFKYYKKLYDWKKPTIRKWPDKEISKAPIWCSVDLRDGNQALPVSMTLEEKIDYFKYLISIGFKEIEVGFPAANETEYKFVRYLIENSIIPDDVKIQVLTQAREEIIDKTFTSLNGAKNVIVNFYNSLSKIQRDVVFRKNKDEVRQIAVNGANLLYNYSLKYPKTNWQFEYSAESFTNTEIDYAIEVVNAVLKEWKVVNTKPIINLPSTVECSTPNIFADQIEYVCENIHNRENIIISVHTHNDRGTANAAAEMALLAGAERVEGTLFGNGERTGMVDLITLAMNMYTTGINPNLNFSNINESKQIYENCTKMVISPRHPYAGELVFTAFSGSHQDAISKVLKNIKKNKKIYWEVPYLTINPEDINRQYEPIIRINSQSGKGGISYILETKFGYRLPKKMQDEVGTFYKKISEEVKGELSADKIISYFINEFQNRDDIIRIENYEVINNKKYTLLNVIYRINDKEYNETKKGNGPIDAFVKSLKDNGYNFYIEDYIQKSLRENNEKSQAITYVSISINEKIIWGIGRDSDITKSGLKAILSALNRFLI